MLSALQKSSFRAAVRGSLSSRFVAKRGFAGKEIKFGIEGRAAMLKGVDTLADAVQVSQSRIYILVLDSFVKSVWWYENLVNKKESGVESFRLWFFVETNEKESVVNNSSVFLFRLIVLGYIGSKRS